MPLTQGEVAVRDLVVADDALGDLGLPVRVVHGVRAHMV
jgi:hypothetical protein